MIKERPILFSAPMVRAILDGSKTQTRRIMKDKYYGRPVVYLPDADDNLKRWYADSAKESNPDCWGIEYFIEYDPLTLPEIARGSGNVGEKLWVRETWQAHRQTNHECDEWEALESPKDRHDMHYEPCYQADGINFPDKWFPSIHMPREFSRINLEIIAVRVERLHDITESDARAEGVAPAWLDADNHTTVHHDRPPTYRQGFSRLWCDINGDKSWDDNPWVRVVEFKRVKP